MTNLNELQFFVHVSQTQSFTGAAKRLGVPEQQVQRWEANSYSGVAIERLQEVADALQLQGLETVTYAVPA